MIKKPGAEHFVGVSGQCKGCEVKGKLWEMRRVSPASRNEVLQAKEHSLRIKNNARTISYVRPVAKMVSMRTTGSEILRARISAMSALNSWDNRFDKESKRNWRQGDDMACSRCRNTCAKELWRPFEMEEARRD